MPTNGDLPPAPNGVPSEVLPLPPNNQSASAQATAPAPPVSGPAAGAGAPRGRSGVSDGLVTDIPPPRPVQEPTSCSCAFAFRCCFVTLQKVS